MEINYKNKFLKYKIKYDKLLQNGGMLALQNQEIRLKRLRNERYLFLKDLVSPLDNTLVNASSHNLFIDKGVLYNNISSLFRNNSEFNKIKFDFNQEKTQRIINLGFGRGIDSVGILLFNLSNSIDMQFKIWELNVCIPYTNNELTFSQKETIINDTYSFPPMRYIPCLFGIHPETNKYSAFGCGFNLLTFLDIINIRTSMNEIQKLVNSNNNDNKGLSTGIIMDIINGKFLNLPKLNRYYSDFYESRTRTPSIERIISILSVLFTIENTIKSYGPNHCVIVKQMINDRGLGHTVLFCMKHNKDGILTLYVVDPQLGKFRSAINIKAIIAFSITYIGFDLIYTDKYSDQPITIFNPKPKLDLVGGNYSDFKKLNPNLINPNFSNRFDLLKMSNMENISNPETITKSGVNVIPLGVETHEADKLINPDDITQAEVDNLIEKINSKIN
jgi:hypothetical protein